MFCLLLYLYVIIFTAQIETGCRRSRRPKSESVINRNCIWAGAYKYNYYNRQQPSADGEHIRQKPVAHK